MGWEILMDKKIFFYKENLIFIFCMYMYIIVCSICLLFIIKIRCIGVNLLGNFVNL